MRPYLVSHNCTRHTGPNLLRLPLQNVIICLSIVSVSYLTMGIASQNLVKYLLTVGKHSFPFSITGSGSTIPKETTFKLIYYQGISQGCNNPMSCLFFCMSSHAPSNSETILRRVFHQYFRLIKPTVLLTP